MAKKRFFKIVGLFILSFMLLDVLMAKGLEEGLKRYYGIGEDSELALVGHSHLMLGVDKVQLENALDLKVSKYTREGVNVSDRYMMLQQLIRSNSNLKTVIYGVDAWTFTGEGLSENSHKLFYPFLEDEAIDDYVKAKDETSDYLAKKVIKSSRFNEQLLGGAFRGYLGKWDNLKYGVVDTLRLRKEIQQGVYRKIQNDSTNISWFKKSVSLLLSHNIEVILVYVPTIDMLESIQKEKFQETIILFENSTNAKVEFINLQEPWSHRYELFYDPIHLNPTGQKQITAALIKRLKK